MPELPDLQVFALNLDKRFKGKFLVALEVFVVNKLNVSVKQLRRSLEGKRLEMVSRVGKTLQLHFEDASVLGLHLMLHGALKPLDQKDLKFQIMAFKFQNGDGFALTDFQKLATPTFLPEVSLVPDALDISYDYFAILLSKKRIQIKTLLMDQKLIRGIGNTYADEILWLAGISPFSISKAIPSIKSRSCIRQFLIYYNRKLPKLLNNFLLNSMARY